MGNLLNGWYEVFNTFDLVSGNYIFVSWASRYNPLQEVISFASEKLIIRGGLGNSFDDNKNELTKV